MPTSRHSLLEGVAAGYLYALKPHLVRKEWGSHKWVCCGRGSFSTGETAIEALGTWKHGLTAMKAKAEAEARELDMREIAERKAKEAHEYYERLHEKELARRRELYRKKKEKMKLKLVEPAEIVNLNEKHG
jgi:hypothetical protein